MLKTEKIVSEAVSEELAEKVISYAEKHGMTISIVRGCFDLVVDCMERNAVMESGNEGMCCLGSSDAEKQAIEVEWNVSASNLKEVESRLEKITEWGKKYPCIKIKCSITQGY